MTDIPALISLNEACRVTSLSRAGIFKLRTAGKFPMAVSLGEKRIAFSREEVAAWVNQRLAERTSAAGPANAA